MAPAPAPAPAPVLATRISGVFCCIRKGSSLRRTVRSQGGIKDSHQEVFVIDVYLLALPHLCNGPAKWKLGLLIQIPSTSSKAKPAQPSCA